MHDDDVDVMVEQDPKGLWCARMIHRVTGTIKISDMCEDRESAIASATEGLAELLKERIKGLGEKK